MIINYEESRLLEIDTHYLDTNDAKAKSWLYSLYLRLKHEYPRKNHDTLILVWRSDLIKMIENNKT